VKSLGFDEYQRLSEAGGLVPVYREIPGDLLTPVSAFLALAGQVERAFLLESVVGGEGIARYSFLGRNPVSTLEVRGRRLVERRNHEERAVEEDLLSALRARVGRSHAEVPGLPRFTGGAVGYLTYDAVRLFERLPERHPGEEPVASFSFYRSLVAFDHVLQRLVLIADAEPASRRAYGEAQSVLDGLEADLRAYRPASARRRAAPSASESAGEGAPLGDGGVFRASVAQAKEHIAAGDIFQVVLSRGRTVPARSDPFTVYRALRMVNPSPYMYFLKDGSSAIAGASPEMLVRVENREVETRPIAGTRRRGRSDEEDARLGEELLADAKERAEHVMLVDLGRNDLGRICDYGTVRVTEQMTVERYSHVMHIVSNVEGRMRADVTALDVLGAAFPAGTVSGAPKVRAMEIIDELEKETRGIYAGAVGYIDFSGNLDFCITIRTIVIKGATAYVQAGAGIVADSDPAAEYQETLNKAKALLKAIEQSGGFH
jgi:anthranilate synthase component 1